MKKKLIIAAVAVVVVIGLGITSFSFATAGNPLVMTESQMAKELEKSDWVQGDKHAKVTDVTCIKSTDTTFTCMGTMEGDEPSNVTWTVTVGSNGAWIANPS
jgi:uncharacterized protein YxeA